MFSEAELDHFQTLGFVTISGLAQPDRCARMVELAQKALAAEVGSVEYEADVHYPGAPPSRSAPGGHTIRRLLQAYARDASFREWALDPGVVSRLKQLLGPRVVMPQAHHNCIMTKQPRFSSDTLWHQDIRYWSFARPDLISVWLALGPERPANGCLYLLPGSHRMNFDSEQLDQATFLRPELSANQALIAKKVAAELNTGDVLFFHCRTLHAASRNQTDDTKFSVVFTYRATDNKPLPGTRSSMSPELDIV